MNFFLFVLLSLAVASASRWDGMDLTNVPVKSYLFPTTKNPNKGVTIIKELMKAIHWIQHPPPPQQCKDKRFLVLNLKSDAFEGTGSLLKQVLIAVSQAIHSDRTLVWGEGLPYLLESCKDEWGGENRHKVNISGSIIDCSNSTSLNGPLGCFFEQLASCSLSRDASTADVVAFGKNPYNESGKILVGEYRKAISLYYMPEGLLEHVLAQPHIVEKNIRHEDFEGIEGHLWAAAVAAYAFRPTSSVLSAFYQRLGSQIHEIQSASSQLWGMHVRHGDLKSLKAVYRYKKVYEFEDYFSAIRDLSHQLKGSPRQLLVSTDSVEADRIEELFQDFSVKTQPALRKGVSSGLITLKLSKSSKKGKLGEHSDEEEEADDWGLSSSSSSSSLKKKFKPYYTPKTNYWFNESKEFFPRAFSVSSNLRFRTPHGSHTVAANGACIEGSKGVNQQPVANPSSSSGGKTCAMQFEDMLKYQSLDAVRLVPISKRIMRVIFESVEDLFLLSHVSALVAQGSSHFSTMAALLIWARTGCENALLTVKFLDQAELDKGVVPTAFLEGMNLLNGTYGLNPNKVPDAGQQRFTLVTKQFITGLETYATPQELKRLGYNPWSTRNMIQIVDLLPQLPHDIFYREARSWQKDYNWDEESREYRYRPLWPGDCPGRMKGKDADPREYVVKVTDWGAQQHFGTHPGQAMQCWADAQRVVDAVVRRNKNASTVNFMQKDVVPVLSGNMNALSLPVYYNLVTLRSDAYKYFGVRAFEDLQMFQLENNTDFLQFSPLTGKRLLAFDSFKEIRGQGSGAASAYVHGRWYPEDSMDASQLDKAIAGVKAKIATLKLQQDKLVELNTALAESERRKGSYIDSSNYH